MAGGTGIAICIVRVLDARTIFFTCGGLLALLLNAFKPLPTRPFHLSASGIRRRVQLWPRFHACERKQA